MVVRTIDLAVGSRSTRIQDCRFQRPPVSLLGRMLGPCWTWLGTGTERWDPTRRSGRALTSASGLGPRARVNPCGTSVLVRALKPRSTRQDDELARASSMLGAECERRGSRSC